MNIQEYINLSHEAKVKLLSDIKTLGFYDEDVFERIARRLLSITDETLAAIVFQGYYKYLVSSFYYTKIVFKDTVKILKIEELDNTFFFAVLERHNDFLICPVSKFKEDWNYISNDTFNELCERNVNEEFIRFNYATEDHIIPYTIANNFINQLGVRLESLKIKYDVLNVDSNTTITNDETARFSGAPWFGAIQKKVVVLAGIGGIGSYVAFLLARVHPKSIFLYDDDVIERVNMSGQLYSLSDIGSNKALVMSDKMSSYSNYHSTFVHESKFTEDCEPANIMMCGFDNMKARKTYFTSWLNLVMSKSIKDRKHMLFIDGRLAAEDFQVLCIRGDDTYNIEKYKNEYLFDDSQADATVCSYKQTSYVANIIGSVMVNLLINFVTNEELNFNINALPFLTTYDAQSMLFKTEN